MKKYKTLIIFLILTAIWSAFFSVFKFFLWGDLKTIILNPETQPDLQEISWYLSLWWAISFLVWWALAHTFLKKYFLFFISLFALIFTTLGFFVWMNNKIILSATLITIWIFYGLRTVVRNIIISIEIKKTWLPDTMINALVSIIFIVSLIAWTIIWWLLTEKLWHNGLYIIIAILTASCIVSLLLDYDKISLKSLLINGVESYYLDRKTKISKSMKQYIPDIKHISKKYFAIIIVSSLLWAVSTIVSQKWVEFSTQNFDKKNSEAAFILLYSAVWAIIWNIVSMKMEKNRWKYFLIFNIILWLLIIGFPFFSTSFLKIKIMAFIIWIFFWWASNLLDAYFFRKIWEDNKKEYGSATYGLILSLTIFIMMFISSNIDKIFWYKILLILLWIIILSTNIIIIKRK